jgi:exosortase B
MDLARTMRPIGPALPWLICIAAVGVVYAPTFLELLNQEAGIGDQSASLLILLLSLLLFWRKWPQVCKSTATRNSLLFAWALTAVGALAFLYGRILLVPTLEVFSLIPILSAIIMLLRGPKHLRAALLPLFFLLFVVPLPGTIVTAITQPMQHAVSVLVESTLYYLGLPISRNGVILQIGQYRLLVAEACAGLNTLFALEALGLLYINLVRSASLVRNLILAILILPIALLANTIRVVILCLITYYFGDAAGQGFLHGFAGMLMFVSALIFTMIADWSLEAVLKRRYKANAHAQ